MPDHPLDPDRSALLVMDFQDGILSRLPSDVSGSLVCRVVRAVDTARAAGAAIGFVRVAFTDADYDAMPPSSGMGARLRSREAMHADAPTTAHHPRLAPQPGDVAVRKTRIGAFTTTDLAEQLTARGIDTLVLAGVSTSGVVLSTVRDAFDRDYRLVMLADGCADPRPGVHEHLVADILPAQAQVVGTSDLTTLFAG